MGERREASILTYALGTEFLILTYKSDIEKIIIFIHLYDLYQYWFCSHKVYTVLEGIGSITMCLRYECLIVNDDKN